MRVGLVACVAAKQSEPCHARDLYTSTLFRYSRAYAERTCDTWFILSALHGLLDPTTLVSPYNVTLTSASRIQRDEWGRRVGAQLNLHARKAHQLVVLAGDAYLGFRPYTTLPVELPLGRLPIGRRLQWLKQHAQ